MMAINVYDNVDVNTNYGVLICANETIDEDQIQNRICEIKEQFEDSKQDWEIEDVISLLPKDWLVLWQPKDIKVTI